MKFNLSKKQKRLSLSILVLILIISLIFFIVNYTNQKKKNEDNNISNSTIIKPVFLDAAEKAALNISPETKVQVIKRTAAGKILLYKVIKNNNDIITDLNQIKPLTAQAEK